MRRYVLQRLGTVVPTVFGITLVIFLMIHLIPGDAADVLLGMSTTPEAAAALRRMFGLDQPLHVQYLTWIGAILHGDLGTSLRTGQPVTQQILLRFPITLELTVASLLVSLLIALPVGVVSAVKQYSALDYVATVVALLGLSTPAFWLGTILIILFALVVPVFPPGNFVSPGEDWLQNLRSLVLPSLTLGTGLAATVMRMTRSSLLEVIGQDYIRTARVKGLRERTVITRHALKNALIPVVTTIGLQTGYLLGGAVVIEQVFGFPGMGSLTIDAVLYRDYPTVQGAILVFGLVFVLINLGVDILYAFLNPQIRYT
jgi:peptide/nickel transport system permease protein